LFPRPARFEGVHFAMFDENNTPAMRNSRVTGLFEAADGTSWIGDEGGHLTQYKMDNSKRQCFVKIKKPAVRQSRA